jgi:hypothetical protein
MHRTIFAQTATPSTARCNQLKKKFKIKFKFVELPEMQKLFRLQSLTTFDLNIQIPH